MNPNNRQIKSKALASHDTYVLTVISILRQVMPGIVKTFGGNCEVLLHDFRDPAHSIVAIEGNVTNRCVGGSVSQIGLSMIALGDDADDQINYITRTPTGRVLKSTTTVLRDSDSHVFGAFCINFDVTDLRKVTSAINELVGASDEVPEPVTFAEDISGVIEAILTEEEHRIGHAVDRMKKSERLKVFRALERRGVFAIRRSVPQAAELLGVSRTTAYKYLEELRLESTARGV